jgi:hypothetical protein
MINYRTIILLALVLLLCSCTGHKIRGSGILRTETRDLPTFENMRFEGSYDIQIDSQEKQALTIDADENLLPLIKTEVTNNSLRVYSDDNLQPSKEIKIIAAVGNLAELTVHGSVHGDINKIQNHSLSVEVNGSSKLQMNGKTEQLKIDISGSSSIDATALVAENAKVRINGSGNIHVQAVNTVDGQINGSGTIKYKGEPRNIHQEINGSGNISKE